MIQQDLFDSGYDVDLLEKRKYLAHLADPLLEAHGNVCYLCGEKVDRGDCEVEHIIPLKHGGTNDWENLRPAHWYCNQAKSTMMPDNPNLQAVIDAIPDKIKTAIRQHKCLDCGIKIKDRHWRAIYCKPCAEKRKKETHGIWMEENKVHVNAYRRDWRRRTGQLSDKVPMTPEERRQHESEKQKEKYANDSEYRAKCIERALAWYYRNKHAK